MLIHLIVLISQLIAVLGQGADFYTNDPNIYELTSSNFDKVVHKSNYTTVVEFYAPWCGYCQQLKQSYTKLGSFMQKDSKYAVNVAAVNCDKGYNKQLCSEHQVTGFPSIKVFRPPKYDSKNKPTGPTRHVSEVYSGKRTFKPLTQFVISRIKNYAKKLHSIEGVSKWIQQTKDYRYKVLLLTEAKDTSTLYKSLAVDFLPTLKFAVLNKNSGFTGTIKIGDEQVELPVKDTDPAPVLLLIDTETNTIIKYDGSKFNDKIELSKWLSKQTGFEPIEGELSKKDQKYYSGYRTGKKAKKIVHDEL